MALNHKRPRRRRRAPNNKTGMILISAVLVLVFLVTFARVLTLKNGKRGTEKRRPRGI